MTSQSTAKHSKVQYGESTNPRDVERRVLTLFHQVSKLAYQLKNLEDLHEGGLTFVLLVSASSGSRKDSTICMESKNMLGWTTEQAAKIIEDAESGRWSMQQSVAQREENARTSREMFSSCGAIMEHFNVCELRKLLVVCGFDGMKTRIKNGKIPDHMKSMLAESHKFSFPSYDRPIGEEEEEECSGSEEEEEDSSKDESDGGDNSSASSNGDAFEKSKCNKVGERGRYVSKLGKVSEAEGSHLTNFDAWEKQEEGDEEGEMGAEKRSILNLDHLIGRGGSTCFTVCKGNRRECIVALQFLLEFQQPGSFSDPPTLHLLDLSFLFVKFFFVNYLCRSATLSTALCLNKFSLQASGTACIST